MRKSFKLYAAIWALMLVVFNVAAIVAPGWPTLEKTTPSFWIGYAFVNAAFVGQMICAAISFKDDSADKVFYNVSLFKVSYAGLISTAVVGLICMVISPLPYWISGIVCSLVLIVNAVAVVKVKIAVNLVTEVDEKIEISTRFIYNMRAESKSLFDRTKEPEAKAVCKKVYEAIRFSDPMSTLELMTIENDIKSSFDSFEKAVLESKKDLIHSESQNLLALVSERNNLCKRMK